MGRGKRETARGERDGARRGARGDESREKVVGDVEEANVPYVYVHSKEELGAAGMTKRPTSVMLVMPEGAKGSVKMSSSDKKEFDDMYEKIVAKVKSMH